MFDIRPLDERTRKRREVTWARTKKPDRVPRSGREDVRCNTASYTPLLRNNCCACTVAYACFQLNRRVIGQSCGYVSQARDPHWVVSLSARVPRFGDDRHDCSGRWLSGSRNAATIPASACSRVHEKERREKKWCRRQWIEVLWGGTKRASLLI